MDSLSDLKASLIDNIYYSLDEKGRKWLERTLDEMEVEFLEKNFFLAYSATPRVTGKVLITLSSNFLADLSKYKSGWHPAPWSVAEAVRILLLLHIPSDDRGRYLKTINDLSNASDASELRSIYLALPFLKYPQEWIGKTTEGIRSNIKEVFEAIAFNNPYPTEFLSDNAWNQMVLKTVFTGSSISKIFNFDSRSNEDLSRMLLDLAHERWAAGREISPEIWGGIAPYLNESMIPDITKLFESENILEREAGALVCYSTNIIAFKELLNQRPLLKSEITTGQISWDKIALSNM